MYLAHSFPYQYTNNTNSTLTAGSWTTKTSRICVACQVACIAMETQLAVFSQVTRYSVIIPSSVCSNAAIANSHRLYMCKLVRPRRIFRLEVASSAGLQLAPIWFVCVWDDARSHNSATNSITQNPLFSTQTRYTQLYLDSILFLPPPHIRAIATPHMHQTPSV